MKREGFGYETRRFGLGMDKREELMGRIEYHRNDVTVDMSRSI